jgi:hypothetical protein
MAIYYQLVPTDHVGLMLRHEIFVWFLCCWRVVCVIWWATVFNRQNFQNRIQAQLIKKKIVRIHVTSTRIELIINRID